MVPHAATFTKHRIIVALQTACATWPFAPVNTSRFSTSHIFTLVKNEINEDVERGLTDGAAKPSLSIVRLFVELFCDAFEIRGHYVIKALSVMQINTILTEQKTTFLKFLALQSQINNLLW